MLNNGSGAPEVTGHSEKFRGKERLKIWIFKRFLKTVTDGADVTFCGRLFRGQELSGDRKSSIADG